MLLPRWIEPQLSKLAVKAPTGPDWVHEIKFDGYRMAARIEKGHVKLLTRSGLDWTEKYPMTAAAFARLQVKTAYGADLEGPLRVEPDLSGQGTFGSHRTGEFVSYLPSPIPRPPCTYGRRLRLHKRPAHAPVSRGRAASLV
jgi:ATP dependent DNA ligase domain